MGCAIQKKCRYDQGAWYHMTRRVSVNFGRIIFSKLLVSSTTSSRKAYHLVHKLCAYRTVFTTESIVCLTWSLLDRNHMTMCVWVLPVVSTHPSSSSTLTHTRSKALSIVTESRLLTKLTKPGGAGERGKRGTSNLLLFLVRTTSRIYIYVWYY